MSTRCRARRLVAVDRRLELGRGSRHRRRDGRREPAERFARGRAPLDRAGGRSALGAAACGRERGAFHARRSPMDRSAQRRPRPRNPLLGRRRGRTGDRSAGRDHGHRPQGAVGHLVHRIRRAGGLSHRRGSGIDRGGSPRPRRVLWRSEHVVHLFHGPTAASVRAVRGRDDRRRPRRHLRALPRRRCAAAHPPGTRRGGEYRAHSRPPLHGQRGSRAGAPGARLPAGSLPGPGALGHGRGRIPLALRHHRRPARDRGHGDPA